MKSLMPILSQAPLTALTRIGAAVVLMVVSLLSLRPTTAAQPTVPEGEIHHACMDAYELDDDRWQVSPLPEITAGAPQSRNFDGNTLTGIPDKDWVRFQVVRTGVYTLTTSDLSPLTDTELRLYDANSTLLAQNDDSGAPDFSSQIVWAAPENASGWYYIRVSNNPASASSYANCAPVNPTVVSYTLSLESKLPLFLYLPLVTR